MSRVSSIGFTLLVVVVLTPLAANAEVSDKIFTTTDLTRQLLIGLGSVVAVALSARSWPFHIIVLPVLGAIYGVLFIREMFFSDISNSIEREMGPGYLRLAWIVGLTWVAGPPAAWIYGLRSRRRRSARRGRLDSGP